MTRTIRVPGLVFHIIIRRTGTVSRHIRLMPHTMIHGFMTVMAIMAATILTGIIIILPTIPDTTRRIILITIHRIITVTATRMRRLFVIV